MNKDKITILSRKIVLVIFDICAIQLASFLSLWIRFDFSISLIPKEYVDATLKYAIINTVITILIFYLFKLYKSIWRLASTNELINVVLACFVSMAAQICGMYVLVLRVPRSSHFIYMIVLAMETIGARFFYRFLRIIRNKTQAIASKETKRCAIFGAGRAGELILKDLESGDKHRRAVVLLDDNVAIWGKTLRGIEIMGGRTEIPNVVSRYRIDEIIIAVPSAPKSEIKKILEYCQQTDCELKILPGIYQLLTGDVSISKLRNVEVEDLLGREPVRYHNETIMGYVAGKTVLVTGGGGSIGSELCRQIAAHNPKKLIIVDIYENNAYDIQNELKRKYNVLNDEKDADPDKSDLDLEVLIASVRDAKRMDAIFEKYRPDIVYHAAAHKHVPLMEYSPNEAIKNNVFGTLNVARMADKWGVSRFVLISTDKAVNPTNIMGASKRICEMIVQSLNEESKTEFVAVRFGNVLGSNGSVIPLFKKQIAEGGPITVTHPDIIRYFMTIPEAVSLVLQAGAYAKGGEIFVLDMGQPVKIVDLAKNLIKLSGYTEEEMPIVFTGLRPGEKLYEEMLMKEEGLRETENKLIYIGQPIKFDKSQFENKLIELESIMFFDTADVRKIVSEIVETYKY